jgi:hypothetical protein
VAIDESGARCPQSVYWYRLKPEFAETGLSHEFMLGALLSRTIAYYIFKRFAEVDPARAHAKVTHTRLERMPIPRADLDDPEQKRLHDEVVGTVRRLRAGEARVGGQADMSIDLNLRQLWGLSPDDGLYINLEPAQVPSGQVIRDLFPEGLPKQILGQDAEPRIVVPEEALV